MAGKPGPETVETLKKKNHNVIQTVFKTNTKRLNEKGNKKMKGLWCKK